MKKLSELLCGQKGRVLKIGGAGKLRRRMLDMGITVGTEITLRRVAPLGDPIEIKLRGYDLTLRKTEAELVVLEEITTID
jgi:Fe2+ transport system protein FeoA